MNIVTKTAARVVAELLNAIGNVAGKPWETGRGHRIQQWCMARTVRLQIWADLDGPLTVIRKGKKDD